MKNIHILPTDKPSRLKQNKITKKISLVKNKGIDLTAYTAINIYITSDETAYPYALHLKKQEVLKIKGVGENSGELYHDKGFSYPYECQKIILTTDQDLIEDGVQAIDDEFLEWFVKNPSCESVEIEKMFNVVQFTSREFIYKIIIPKEEAKKEIPQIGTKEFNDLASAYFGGKPKQYLEKEMFDLEQELDVLSNLRWHNSKPKQETLEEAAQRIFSDFGDITRPSAIKRALELAKWQQERMYSEEEVLSLIIRTISKFGGETLYNYISDEEIVKWFNKVKK